VFFKQLLFPALVAAAAIALGAGEIRNYLRLHRLDQPAAYPPLRLVRRLCGAVVLLILGVMLYVGVSYIPLPQDRHDLRAVWFWMICLILVGVVLVMAMLDVAEGLKRIRKTIDQL